MPLFLPFVRRDPLHPVAWHLSRNTKDRKLSYGENPKSLSYLVLERYRNVTDTNGVTIANTRYSTYAIAFAREKEKNCIMYRKNTY